MTTGNTYEITIVNESPTSQSYILFSDAPQVSGANSGNVFQNVWMTAPTIPSRPDGSSQTTFTIPVQYYAICGTSSSPIKNGVTVATSDYELVQLGTSTQPGTTLDFTTKGGAQFTDQVSPAAPPGAFTIVADDSIQEPDPNNTFIGLGARDMHENVIPVATVPVLPQYTYNFTPSTTFYIATGSFVEGQVVDIQQVGPYLEIDFSQMGGVDSVTYINTPSDGYQQASTSDAKKFKLERLAQSKAAIIGEIAAPARPLPPKAGKKFLRGSGGAQHDLVKEEQLAKELQKTLAQMIRSVKVGA